MEVGMAREMKKRKKRSEREVSIILRLLSWMF